MRSTDTSNPEDESCADLSETFVLQAADSDASLSPAHTTIVTVRRSSAPAVVQQSQEELGEELGQEQGQNHTEIANETVTIERDYRAL